MSGKKGFRPGTKGKSVLAIRGWGRIKMTDEKKNVPSPESSKHLQIDQTMMIEFPFALEWRLDNQVGKGKARSLHYAHIRNDNALSIQPRERQLFADNPSPNQENGQ